MRISVKTAKKQKGIPLLFLLLFSVLEIEGYKYRKSCQKFGIGKVILFIGYINHIYRV